MNIRYARRAADDLRSDSAGQASPAVRTRDDRATVRVAIVVEAEVALSHDPAKVYPAETLDISPAGVGFLLREPLPIGAVVRFRCVIPGRQPVPIDVEATIRWHREVSANHTVLARDVHRHGAAFAPLPRSVEDAIVSALLFIETRRA
jgi:hypothetical protein